MVDVPHGDHLLGLEDFAVASGARVVVLGALDGPRLDGRAVQEAGLRGASACKRRQMA